MNRGGASELCGGYELCLLTRVGNGPARKNKLVSTAVVSSHLALAVRAAALIRSKAVDSTGS